MLPLVSDFGQFCMLFAFSHAFHRCGATGEVWTSGYADGARASGLHDLEPSDALRSARSNLAQSRSVRAFEWPRIDASMVRRST